MKIRKHNNNASNNIKKIFQEQYRLIPFLIERFSNNLEKNSIFYLKNLNNTIKKRYFIYILKTLILSNIIIIFKKL